jgi:hypothetical protein
MGNHILETATTNSIAVNAWPQLLLNPLASLPCAYHESKLDRVGGRWRYYRWRNGILHPAVFPVTRSVCHLLQVLSFQEKGAGRLGKADLSLTLALTRVVNSLPLPHC